MPLSITISPFCRLHTSPTALPGVPGAGGVLVADATCLAYKPPSYVIAPAGFPAYPPPHLTSFNLPRSSCPNGRPPLTQAPRDVMTSFPFSTIIWKETYCVDA